MEQQTDVRTLLDRGDTLLRDEKAAEAAAEFARAVQLDPNAVGGHLGLAEANLALGQFGIAQQAANYVRELAPGSADAALADAILAVIAHNYDAALDAVEREIDLDPTRPYSHALRAYVLRRLSRNYDAALAEARAARLSGKRDWSALFPQSLGYSLPSPIPAPPPSGDVVPAPGRVPPPDSYAGTPHRIGYAQQRQWQGSWGGRRMVRLRLLLATTPAITYSLIAINVFVYLVCAVLARDFVTPLPLSFDALLAHPGQYALYLFGSQVDPIIASDPLQAYRFLSAMFLHASIIHIGANMLSLYFVGIITERLFGAGRYTLIYFASGILAGIAQFAVDMLTNQPGFDVGASGAIFGIFGAFGAFILLRRRALGPAANTLIGQWVFFLLLNLYLSFGGFSILGSGIAGFAHLGGLVAGLILGAIFSPQVGIRRR